MTGQPVTARRSDFRGWYACWLENSLIRLVATPDIGGRVMAYDLGDHPFLFVDDNLAGRLFSPEENQGDGSLAAWKNYGGDKTWPAPQGWECDDQWHGPPDPVLDTGRYTLDALHANGRSAAVQMTSPPDERTGLQISRRFTLQERTSRVAVELSFRNVGQRPLRWSIWDVTQLRAECTLADGSRAYDPTCVVTAPLNPASRHPRGYHVMFGAEDNPQWQTRDGLFWADYRWVIGKVGLDSPGGWIAFHQGSEGVAFVTRFEHDPAGEYPDNGSTVECWTVGAGVVGNLNYAESGVYLMETEVLGPLQTILPGKSSHFSLQWAACRCSGAVRDVTPAGCVGAAFSARSVASSAVHLSGSFGVFDEGLLQAAWLDDAGNCLRVDPLGSVTPLEEVRLDRIVVSPAEARQVELLVNTAGGDMPSRLASTRM